MKSEKKKTKQNQTVFFTTKLLKMHLGICSMSRTAEFPHHSFLTVCCVKGRSHKVRIVCTECAGKLGVCSRLFGSQVEGTILCLVPLETTDLPKQITMYSTVKPGSFEKFWNFSVNLNCYNKGGKSIVFLMIKWKSLSLTGPLYCFTDAKQEREELNFKKRPPGSPLTLSTVIVQFRHVDRTN